MNTRLTELLNIKYPILQGAMAWVSEANLAAAVSNAGGAGIIASGGRDSDWLREQVKLAKELTDKPFGVNLVMMDKGVEDKVKVLCEEKVAFVTTGAGNPLPVIEKLHEAGIKVIPVVPNLKLAKRVEERGADAVVIEGMEAGGHIGKLTTMALMTQVIPEMNIPVIAAGGLSDGRGLAAALVMGAAGVQVGTRFYASEECISHINTKKRIVEAGDTDTVITGELHGHAVRTIKNNLSEEYLKMERSGASEEELIKLVTGTSRKAPYEGDVEWGAVHAGQSLTVIDKIEPCSTIIEGMIKQANEAIKAIIVNFT